MSAPHERNPTTPETPSPFTGNHKDNARAFQAAASFIESRCSKSADRNALEVSQRRTLEEWARTHSLLISAEHIECFQIVSNCTSEHEVFFRDRDRRAVKRTWAGIYGQIPAPKDGKLDRIWATPSEYLLRMALQIEVFQSDITLEGACICNKPPLLPGRQFLNPKHY